MTCLQDLNKPCAQWALVRPSAVLELLQQLTSIWGDSKAWADGLANGPLLTKEQVQRVQPLMSSTDFMVLYQKPGDMVIVPCGWVHQVVNMQNCVRIACNVSNPEQPGLQPCILEASVEWHHCNWCQHAEDHA